MTIETDRVGRPLGRSRRPELIPLLAAALILGALAVPRTARACDLLLVLDTTSSMTALRSTGATRCESSAAFAKAAYSGFRCGGMTCATTTNDTADVLFDRSGTLPRVVRIVRAGVFQNDPLTGLHFDPDAWGDVNNHCNDVTQKRVNVYTFDTVGRPDHGYRSITVDATHPDGWVTLSDDAAADHVYDLISDLFDQCPGGDTPLADAMCATTAVVPPGGDTKGHLKLNTDGEENSSTGPCHGPSDTTSTVLPFMAGTWQANVMTAAAASRWKLDVIALFPPNYFLIPGGGGIDPETGRPSGRGPIQDTLLYGGLAASTGGKSLLLEDDDPVSTVADPGLIGLHTLTTSSSTCFGLASSNTLPVPVAGGTCPGCVLPRNYVAADWRDFLRVLYFGTHHDPAKTRDCNSDVRHALVANYDNLFDGCAAGACTGKSLIHAWRPPDGSPVTDTFIALIGGLPPGYAIAAALPADPAAQQSNPFCNAGTGPTNFRVTTGFSDFRDEDPMRVTCGGNGKAGVNGVQVCGDAFNAAHLKNLGLVLPVFIPDATDVPPADAYPAGECGTSAKLLPARTPTYTGMCPAGNLSFGGKCFQNTIVTGPGTFNANCNQTFAPAGRCPPLVPAGRECRGANLWLRKPNGEIAIDTHSGPSRLIIGAFYKIHHSSTETGGVGTCTWRNPLDQVSCLGGLPSPCSVGISARVPTTSPSTLVYDLPPPF